MKKTIIGSVDILSREEQISFVVTNRGSYVVGYIPDATLDDDDWRDYILARVNSIDEAHAWFKKNYGA